uniref:Cold acclimation-specific protein n=1 Tax=Medicago sativa subsp. falcata TaxID=3878 RepID=Q40331_MEDSF|nr:cold acclimation-specific protein [Medicago sativa subsp. falcata]
MSQYHGENRGVVDKIKEKIPVALELELEHGTGTGTGHGTTGYGSWNNCASVVLVMVINNMERNRGAVDKIKEKIPGTEQNVYGTGTGTGTGTGHGTGTGTGHGHGTTTGYGSTGQEYGKEGHHGHDEQHLGEKKGIMEKIKEKIPGTGSCTGHGQTKPYCVYMDACI